MKKATKKENYAAIIAIIEDAQACGKTLDGVDNITFDSLIEFINHEIELVNNKAAAAQKRSTAKKAAGEALCEHIYNCLTDEPQTIPAIVKVLNDPDITTGMVTARLTQLCNSGRVVKESLRIPATEDNRARTLSAYRLA